MSRIPTPSAGDSVAGGLRAGGELSGVLRGGHVLLEFPVDWPDGTHVVVRPAPRMTGSRPPGTGHVIIAGFGLSGRCIADFLEKRRHSYTIVDHSASTVRTQKSLGRTVVHGDIAVPDVLKEAGVDSASMLALTIPDDKAMLHAVASAREFNPHLYIIARTSYVSSGLKAVQHGADEVIPSEQSVALQFHHALKQRFASAPPEPAP